MPTIRRARTRRPNAPSAIASQALRLAGPEKGVLLKSTSDNPFGRPRCALQTSSSVYL